MSAATDRFAPRYVRLSGEVADQAILDALAAGHVSSRAIAEATNVSVHVVSVRLNQLAAEGVVERTGKIKHGLRGMAYTFKVRSP